MNLFKRFREGQLKPKWLNHHPDSKDAMTDFNNEVARRMKKQVFDRVGKGLTTDPEDFDIDAVQKEVMNEVEPYLSWIKKEREQNV